MAAADARVGRLPDAVTAVVQSALASAATKPLTAWREISRLLIRLPPKLRDLAAPADAATDATTPTLSSALDTLALTDRQQCALLGVAYYAAKTPDAGHRTALVPLLTWTLTHWDELQLTGSGSAGGADQERLLFGLALHALQAAAAPAATPDNGDEVAAAALRADVVALGKVALGRVLGVAAGSAADDPPPQPADRLRDLAALRAFLTALQVAAVPWVAGSLQGVADMLVQIAKASGSWPALERGVAAAPSDHSQLSNAAAQATANPTTSATHAATIPLLALRASTHVLLHTASPVGCGCAAAEVAVPDPHASHAIKDHERRWQTVADALVEPARAATTLVSLPAAGADAGLADFCAAALSLAEASVAASLEGEKRSALRAEALRTATLAASIDASAVSRALALASTVLNDSHSVDDAVASVALASVAILATRYPAQAPEALALLRMVSTTTTSDAHDAAGLGAPTATALARPAGAAYARILRRLATDADGRLDVERVRRDLAEVGGSAQPTKGGATTAAAHVAATAQASAYLILAQIATEFAEHAAVSEDVRALLTEQFNQSHGRLDAAILTALGDLMVGGHPNVFQPSLDFLADVVKGTAGQAVDSAGGVAADGASVRRTSDSPSLAVLLANRRTAYVVLDHVSAAFKASGARSHMAFVTALALLLIELVSALGDRDQSTHANPQAALPRSTSAHPAAAAAVSSTAAAALSLDVMRLDVIALVTLLASHLDRHPDASALARAPRQFQLLVLFRYVWYFLIIHSFVPLSRAAISPTAIETDQLRQSEFLRNAQNGLAQAFVRLATHSPTLSAGVSTAFERELDADPILTGKVYPELNTFTLQSLQPLLKPLDAKKLSPAHRIYLLAVYETEANRRPMTRQVLASLVHLLESEGLRTAPHLGPAIDALCYQVVQQYCLSVEASNMSLTPARRQLELAVQFLILQQCHRLPGVRAATRRWLDRLLATLPALAWSQPVIDTLLQLVNTMADACDAGYGDEPMILSVPGVEGHQLDLPLSVHPSARVLALQALVKLAEEWLSNSLRLAPHELRGQLQDHLVRVARTASLVGPPSLLGVVTAMEVAGRPTDTHPLRGTPGLPPAFFAQTGALAVGMVDRAYLEGQQDALVHLLSGFTKAERAAYVRRCIDELHALEQDKSSAPAANGWDGLLTALPPQPPPASPAAPKAARPHLKLPNGLDVPDRAISPSPSVDDSAREATAAALHARPSVSGKPAELLPSPRTKKSKSTKGKGTKGASKAGAAAASASKAARNGAAAEEHEDAASGPEFATVRMRAIKLEAVGPHGPLPQPHRHDAARATSTLYRAAACLLAQTTPSHALLAALCWVPIRLFQTDTLREAIRLWQWLIASRPELDLAIMTEVAAAWEWTVQHRLGLFNGNVRPADVLYAPVSYRPPTTPPKVDPDALPEAPHALLLGFLLDRLPALTVMDQDHIANMVQVVRASLHPTVTHSSLLSARTAYFRLILLGLRVSVAVHRRDHAAGSALRQQVCRAAFAWFRHTPGWSLGNDRSLTDEISVLAAVHAELRHHIPHSVQSLAQSLGMSPTDRSPTASPTRATTLDISDSLTTQLALGPAQKLLRLLVAYELDRLLLWRDPTFSRPPLAAVASYSPDTDKVDWASMVRFAWSVDPEMAVGLSLRFSVPAIERELEALVREDPAAVIHVPHALQFLLTEENLSRNIEELKHVLHWAPVPPMTALSLFLPRYQAHPLVQRYALRVLQEFPAENVLFYTPQVVQALRFDQRGPLALRIAGLVERYIVNAAKDKSAQLLAHQLIWNMRANTYVDLDMTQFIQPDALQPILERIEQALVESFAEDDRRYFEQEFDFFKQVTGISGALKPYIRRPKSERKAKIDEEMKKISVVPGVYLPSNPSSKVVDIDYQSGRPLQSHAKAPFMATFQVEREVTERGVFGQPEQRRHERLWQSCIFKVGDDCRQDVLALQLIALIQNVFTNVGLDLYTFPYKVVATAPGCGIIEVVPGTISRDILGREHVNDLYQYFLDKYGDEDSPVFQRARANFIRSMAAYSVVVYLLMLRDRHNGNIMVDEEGHIIHIDFGFILGISPGGVVFNDILTSGFETSPFLLKREMVQIMGGSLESAPFQWFTQLVVKGFLAARPYMTPIMQMVELMMHSGLPCFRGEATLKRLQERFQPHLTEKAAAEFMLDRIHESYNNYRTNLYDAFQKMQNGIPY